jgi:hypothetical protein
MNFRFGNCPLIQTSNCTATAVQDTYDQYTTWVVCALMLQIPTYGPLLLFLKPPVLFRVRSDHPDLL